MPISQFNNKLGAVFELFEEIKKLLFDFKGEKFTVNKYTGKQQIKKEYIHKI